MNKQAYYLVISKIEVIEKTEELLKKLNDIKSEPTGRMMIGQMERKKRNLIREMLKEMIDARLSFRQFRSLYEKIFSYLEGSEEEVKMSDNFQKSAVRAEKFLAT